ncbi:MAG: adenylosuccinate lyase, partial [Nanoarchaeota archaeon]|nr:adenylosuccinate lyase [Nanoarchaeota archaeon]
MSNQNILSERYAAKPINDIFSERGKSIAERELWIAVMKSQKELGVDIPSEAIEKYEKAKDDIDLELIKSIETTTKHDVKAKIEAFVKAAGAGEHIHKGMTSRDLTDNVEQMQIKKASGIIFGKYVSVLRHMVDKAKEYKNIILTARTHHQAAQPTLLGRRFSMWAEELLSHLNGFESFTETYPLRGIKGPVGTQFDMLTLLGDDKKVAKLEKRVAEELGFKKVLDSTGQMYPRSLDYALVSNLALLSSACENFAKGIRLMSGYELVTEGFKEGQVGSSAMPHKMNTRSSERICSFSELLKMYADGASRLSGDQWEEGDVSCSALRRVIIPDSFYTSDGLCETTLTVLNNMGAYPAVIDKETDKYLPFLATTEILMT